MRSIIVLIAAMLLASCAKLEFEEIVDRHAPNMADSFSNVAMNPEGLIIPPSPIA